MNQVARAFERDLPLRIRVDRRGQGALFGLRQLVADIPHHVLQDVHVFAARARHGQHALQQRLVFLTLGLPVAGTGARDHTAQCGDSRGRMRHQQELVSRVERNEFECGRHMFDIHSVSPYTVPSMGLLLGYLVFGPILAAVVCLFNLPLLSAVRLARRRVHRRFASAVLSASFAVTTHRTQFRVVRNGRPHRIREIRLRCHHQNVTRRRHDRRITMERRSFIWSAVLSAFPARSRLAAGQSVGTRRGVFVPAGRDRFERPLKLGPATPLDAKVTSSDSNGGLYVFEHKDLGKGGPFRHFHHEQDEWFYAIKGEFLFEIGDEKFRLRPGDSIFAPRRIPHVWAHVSDTPGTLLLAVQPAGQLEAFFSETARRTTRATRAEAEQLFAAHGMTVTGDPLPIP